MVGTSMVGASAADGTAVVLIGHCDQRRRASDHRAGREPRAAGIEHSAHYAAASAADSRPPAPSAGSSLIGIDAAADCA
jgi:hypothetical protein